VVFRDVFVVVVVFVVVAAVTFSSSKAVNHGWFLIFLGAITVSFLVIVVGPFSMAYLAIYVVAAGCPSFKGIFLPPPFPHGSSISV
jgi:hypothetical protein